MRKPRAYDSLFGTHVRDAVNSGELTWANVKEWEIEYNDGREPYPDMGTRAIMKYYKEVKNG